MKRFINLQNNKCEKRTREKLFVVIVVASEKKTLSKNSFNSLKHIFFQASKLFDIILHKVLLNKKWIYYRNVWLFIDFVNSTTKSKNFKLIRANFQRYFRDDAQIWHIVELNQLSRDDLHNDHDIVNWKKKH